MRCTRACTGAKLPTWSSFASVGPFTGRPCTSCRRLVGPSAAFAAFDASFAPAAPPTPLPAPAAPACLVPAAFGPSDPPERNPGLNPAFLSSALRDSAGACVAGAGSEPCSHTRIGAVTWPSSLPELQLHYRGGHILPPRRKPRQDSWSVRHRLTRPRSSMSSPAPEDPRPTHPPSPPSLSSARVPNESSFSNSEQQKQNQFAWFRPPTQGARQNLENQIGYAHLI
jgi:hypothetical protein